MDEQTEGESPEAEENAIENKSSCWGARCTGVNCEEDDGGSGHGGDEEILDLLVFQDRECDTWGSHNKEGPGNVHAAAAKLVDEVEHNSQDDEGGEELESL